MIKNKLDNYLIPPINGRLTHTYPKLYIKCPPKMQCHKPKIKKRWENQNKYETYFILKVTQDAMSQTKG